MLRACLAVVLLSCVASPVLAQNGRTAVAATAPAASGNRAGESTTGATADKSSPASGYGHAAAPAASQGGGGDDEGVLRLRAPKWNSFLPGMFR
ncbi:hypothetical protein [Pseudoxanthomonas winnipegensis]|uniref:hypothetical protein n=1 Tax=Pseudoxanthomonas winnipegensis TaxID=2480810 RepID=UPI001F293EC0|nr:hypothetical protein [Pseudoxanthomonas winnipegensis]